MIPLNYFLALITVIGTKQLMKNNIKSIGSNTTVHSINGEIISIPDHLVQKWQRIVNIIAKVIQVPAALIMKVDPPYLEVFCSSDSKNNPYKLGYREHWSGLYCEHVLRTKEDLLIPNALQDKHWDNNPGIKLGMISYFGLPLFWPEGEAFGTICVLDSKENSYNTIYKDLILQFKGLIEAHLELMWNIADRERMEEELISKKKLTVLGQLTTGVGYELRDSLGSIKNAVYLLNMILEEPEPEVKESLAILEKEVETSENIIRSLLDYAQPRALNVSIVDINDLLRIVMSRITIPENIELASQLDEKIPSILADPDQLTQIFRNIISNATYALHDGGQLFIRTKVTDPEWVTISFTDTGVGIPKKNLDHLFEPLFTTKPKEIGLGLAVTKTFVETHGGSIEVQSELGRGCTFKVRLPINTKEGK